MEKREESVRQRLWHLNPKEQDLLSKLLNREIDHPAVPNSPPDDLTLRTIRKKLEKLNLVPFTPKPGMDNRGRKR